MKNMEFLSLRIACVAGLLLTTAACESKPYVPPAPPTGSLTHVFDMVDRADNRLYGTVELDPVNGGKVFDVDGRLIGVIDRDDHYYSRPDYRDYPYRDNYYVGPDGKTYRR